MRKFVLAQNGKEVKVGDVFVNRGTITTDFGEATVIQEILVSVENILDLIKAGIIVEVQSQCANCLEDERMHISYYVNNIADRMGWNSKKTVKFFETLNTIHPAAAFNVVLREIAIELDKKYEDHIENSPKIFVVSSLDGRITEANKAHIKNYKNFAAFRSIDDARIACKITKRLLKNMYKSGK